MIWIINSCRKSGIHNEQTMLRKNVFFIGFGTPQEERHKKTSFTTYKQFNKFKENASKGDTIMLYANRCGIIASGQYLGEYFVPDENEKAPNWNKDEIQYHVKVIKWTKFETPIKYKGRPPTLYSTVNIKN